MVAIIKNLGNKWLGENDLAEYKTSSFGDLVGNSSIQKELVANGSIWKYLVANGGN